MIIFLTVACFISYGMAAFLAGVVWQLWHRSKLERTIVELQTLFSAIDMQPEVGEVLRSLGFVVNTPRNGAVHVVTSQGTGDFKDLVGR